MKRKVFLMTYVVGILAGAFLLFGTMFVSDTDIVTELNQEMVLVENSVAENMDAYLSKNFGFRAELLSFYTKLQALLFKTSSVDKVIIGEQGYLFFEETADDYCGTNILTKREIYNINKTLELMQEYVQNEGAKMLFLVAPNKNSLYDYMPYYYIKSDKKSNWELLAQEMKRVNYVDAFAVFKNQEKELYYKTDSHWNDLGAYYVFEETMRLMGKTSKDRLAGGYTESCSMIGDLQRMLYPLASVNENKLVFYEKSEYEYLTNTRSVEQAYIESYNENGEGSLLMFRDSFANNLIDHYSNVFEYAIYDKGLPYDFSQIQKYDADIVIVEIAERNLDMIQTNIPKFLAPLRDDLSGTKVQGVIENIVFTEEDGWIKVVGTVNPSYAGEDSCFFIKVNQKVYELTPQKIQGSVYGFAGYLRTETWDSEVEFLLSVEGKTYIERVETTEKR